MAPGNKNNGMSDFVIISSNNPSIVNQASWDKDKSPSDSADWGDLKSDIGSLQKQITSLKKTLQTVEKSKDSLSTTVNNLKEESDQLKKQLLESFGLFGTFITFILANVTVFANIHNISIAIAFMGAMLLCMLVFLYGFILFLERDNTPLQSKVTKLIGIVVAGVFVMYLCMFFLEKNISSVIISYKEGKPICVNCQIGKECQVQDIYPMLKEQ